MTKPQIWVAAFLVLFLVLFFIQRVTDNNYSDTPKTLQNTMPQSNISSQNLSPSELIGKLGCVNCHGDDLNGTRMGPSLANVKKYWSRDKLINYLRNPSSFRDAERFKEYEKQFPGGMMPSFNQVDIKELGKIADYLLSK